MPELTGTQRKYLRGLAHALKPVAQLGKGGLTEGFLEGLDRALDDHELVKLKFLDFKDQKQEACAEIESRLRAECAGTIGHVAIFFRPARQPEKRKIKLPQS
ncbi:MAG: YhbY family RNA-binding protein [Thermoanaerobaculia bacterium]|nr:YhbY family RNA-binding protein [Thermoanaerobaculia bacterium]